MSTAVSSPVRTVGFLRPWLLWTVGFVSFPIAGLVGSAVGGRVDSPLAALIGGVATGAVIGLGQGLASSRRLPLVRWILAGTALVAALVVVAIAVWPASEADKAREDGKQVGEAVSSLYGAQTTDEVSAALTDLRTAVSDTRDHATDNVVDQVNDQADALSRAADGFVGSRTSDDSFEADLYQAELDYAVDDLDQQAEDFQNDGPEVQQAFWDGFEDGRNG